MAHPSARYIKYLIIRAKATKFAALLLNVNRVLKSLDLLEVGEDEFTHMVESISVPAGIQFWAPEHERTIEFMKKSQVYEMWNPGKTEEETYSLLKQSLIAETAKILLMGRLEPDEVASLLSMKHGYAVSPSCIEIFRDYFWNVATTSYEEWNTLLTGKQLRGHLLACLYGSKDQARYRAGFNPKVEGKRSLKDLHRTLHFRLEATRFMQDSAHTAETVASLSRELVNVYQAIYGEGAGLEDVLREFKAFMLQNRDPEVVSIKELAPNGNFTGSGVKFLSAKKDDEDVNTDS